MSTPSIDQNLAEIKYDTTVELTFKEKQLQIFDDMNTYFKNHNWVLVQFSDRETMFISKCYFRKRLELPNDDSTKLVIKFWQGCRRLAKLYADEQNEDKWSKFGSMKKYTLDIALFFPFAKEHYNSVLDFLTSPYSGNVNAIIKLCGNEFIFKN